MATGRVLEFRKTEQFITLWESKPFLYDTTKEECHDRNSKKKTREEIVDNASNQRPKYKNTDKIENK